MVMAPSLRLSRLGDGLATSFKWIAERHRLGQVDDLAEAWTSLTASAADGVRLEMYPGIDPGQLNFAFTHPHRIEAETYLVANGGLRGGPSVDLLFQLWIETDEIGIGVGFPLIFQNIPEHGGIPALQMQDLQATCRELLTFTASTRVVLFASGPEFVFERHNSGNEPVLAIDGVTVAGLRVPFRPIFGVDLYRLGHKLASGEGGDPQLSGYYKDGRLLNAFFETFQVRRVLRLKVKKAAEGQFSENT